jgi:hypothetical protein
MLSVIGMHALSLKLATVENFSSETSHYNIIVSAEHATNIL